MAYQHYPPGHSCADCGALEVDGYLSHMHGCPRRGLVEGAEFPEPTPSKLPLFVLWLICQYHDARYWLTSWRKNIWWPEVWVTVGVLVIGCGFMWLLFEAMEGHVK